MIMLYDMYENTCQLIRASQTRMFDSCTAGCRARKRRVESTFARKPLNRSLQWPRILCRALQNLSYYIYGCAGALQSEKETT